MFLKFVCLVFIGGAWTLGKLTSMLGHKLDILKFHVNKTIFLHFQFRILQKTRHLLIPEASFVLTLSLKFLQAAIAVLPKIAPKQYYSTTVITIM